MIKGHFQNSFFEEKTCRLLYPTLEGLLGQDNSLLADVIFNRSFSEPVVFLPKPSCPRGVEGVKRYCQSPVAVRHPVGVEAAGQVETG